MVYTPTPMPATNSLGLGYSSNPYTPTPNSNTEHSRVLGSILPPSPVDRFLDSEPWEYFELHKLMKNKRVRELFNQQSLVNEKVNRLLDDKEKLLNQLHDANKENQSLQAQLTQLQQQIGKAAPSIAGTSENSGATCF
ncbi:hypothetical protein CPB83DRAFT_841382 [Crepidotus variabilis]|uniref:Uncharacterized protein n=1 Tax=Crepidotus variabilis TaxID=179855 RepID=A0A9P6E0Z9_9AGAR|nr:hypothetical protein CPB83DRAFT_841382 [Crepidotus variabilis]